MSNAQLLSNHCQTPDTPAVVSPEAHGQVITQYEYDILVITRVRGRVLITKISYECTWVITCLFPKDCSVVYHQAKLLSPIT